MASLRSSQSLRLLGLGFSDAHVLFNVRMNFIKQYISTNDDFLKVIMEAFFPKRVAVR